MFNNNNNIVPFIWLLNADVSQYINVSISQYINVSISQCLNFSMSQYFNIPIYQCLIISMSRYINISMSYSGLLSTRRLPCPPGPCRSGKLRGESCCVRETHQTRGVPVDAGRDTGQTETSLQTRQEQHCCSHDCVSDG